ncbi:CLUMA_CG013793, isoform A [Clunio marinus]|uniref:CLUMA_CG013793, isoform A n=1 Tax=Clunio marinus TaxID=568069 RepID=A0A1J1ILT9_9DIPT|nr:CLUMA_CG013793, isoform A [Clunio marinus]
MIKEIQQTRNFFLWFYASITASFYGLFVEPTELNVYSHIQQWLSDEEERLLVALKFFSV